MDLRTHLIVFSLSGALLFPTVARSDDVLTDIMLDNKYSKAVHFVLDGKYSCDAAASTEGGTHYQACAFANSCEFFDEVYMFHEGEDGHCIELDLSHSPHKLVMTWADQRVSVEVNLVHIPDAGDFGPETYESLCTFAVRSGDTLPSLNCGDEQH